MTTIHLDPTTANALRAAADLAGHHHTTLDQLVATVVRDWLGGLQPSIDEAARLITQALHGEPDPGRPWTPPAGHLDDTEHAIAAAAAEAATEPEAPAGHEPNPTDDLHAPSPLHCSECGFLAKAPQGLAPHTRKRHRCAACRQPIATGTPVPGIGTCCRRCARDAA